MKILTNLGIVAGIHALVLLVIFASPGCSSSKGQSASADTPAKAADVTPASPTITASPEITAAPDPTAAALPAVGTPASGPILYSPTRPGTPAATAVEAQPVSGVVPASTYTVGANDSLWLVAKKNHLKVSELAAANNLKLSATLHPGQKLIIPAKAGDVAAGGDLRPADLATAPAGAPAAAPAAKMPGESVKHVVRPGETLGAIARKYGVKLGDIATVNNISDPKKIHPGQVLVIPGGKSSGAAKASAASTVQPMPEAAEPAAPASPAANQDLDAGLKPVEPSDVPVLKVDDSPAPASKSP
jgi:LysM repeat protein